MNKIKALREEIGKLYKLKNHILTQKKLGKLMGYSRHQIYRLESGKRQMTEHFEKSLENIETLLRSGNIKIPD